MTLKIGLDAGHGMNTPGKRTPDGVREWYLNNQVAVAVENELETYQNVEVHRLDDRTGKRDVPLKNRTNYANAKKLDFVLSIHQNAFQSKWGNHGGSEVFISKNTSSSNKQLAQKVLNGILKVYKLRNRGIKNTNLHMTRQTKMAAILIECGFMDSLTDKVILDSKKQKELGIELATIIAKHYGLKKKIIAKTQGKYKITTQALNYRAGASTSTKINGTVKRNEVYTITEVKNGWGKLKSGAGWIWLGYTKKL